MYKSIMVPVDLEHQDKLGKALTTAGLFAKEFKADLTLVGVTPTVPTAVAHTPEEFAQKLKGFGERQAGVLGVPVQTKAVTSADPARDLDGRWTRPRMNWGRTLSSWEPICRASTSMSSAPMPVIWLPTAIFRFSWFVDFGCRAYRPALNGPVWNAVLGFAYLMICSTMIRMATQPIAKATVRPMGRLLICSG